MKPPATAQAAWTASCHCPTERCGREMELQHLRPLLGRHVSCISDLRKVLRECRPGGSTRHPCTVAALVMMALAGFIEALQAASVPMDRR